MKILPVGIAVLVVCVLVLVVMAARRAAAAEKKRREEFASALGRLGLTVCAEKKDPRHAEDFSRLGEMTSLSRGASGVRWSARGVMGGRETVLVEHAYTVSTGKSSVTHYHTMAATPCPAGWPALSLDEEGLMGKLAELLGMRDIKLEDEAFNARWRVKSASEDFALLVLGPEAQAWCLRLPKGMSVRVGKGAVVVSVARMVMKPEEAARLAELPGELMGLIPAEVEGFRS